MRTSPSISALRPLLGNGDEEAIAEFGIPAAERQAGEKAGGEWLASSSLDLVLGVADDEFFERRLIERGGENAGSAGRSARLA